MNHFSLREIVAFVFATVCAMGLLVAAGLAEASAQATDAMDASAPPAHDRRPTAEHVNQR